MSRFLFKLDSVLQHRLRLEREAQCALAQRLAVANQLQSELRLLNDSLVESTAALRDGQLVGKINLAYLTAHRRYTADVTRRGTLLIQRLALAKRGVDEARVKLAEAAKQRRILETLRQTHHDRWRSQEGRREELQADELGARMGREIQLEPMAQEEVQA